MTSRSVATNIFPIVLLGGILLRAAFGAEIHVFAAASLTESLKSIAAGFEDETVDKIKFNFGASSFLARQIEERAPADIFFSADEEKMDDLEKRGLVLKGTRRSRLSNSLVVVVAAESQLLLTSPKDLAGTKIKRLALADPRAVPAGIYAKEYLLKLDLWGLIERKVVPTDNVRAALSAVESGNVDAGMVYKTDAGMSKKVKIAWHVPVEEGPPISYPIAILRGCREPRAAKRFLEYLSSDKAGRVFAQAGFIVLPSP